MIVDWTPQRKKVFEDRYSKKDSSGQATEEAPEHMWARVADGIANTKEEANAFLGILKDFKFVPGGRILTGAGSDTEVTFYNCYVIAVRNDSRPANGNDSREAIFDTVSRMVNIMSRGGGVGINWSTLRPNGAYLSRINGTTTGPLEWMDVASKAVGAVMQGGSRRGAAMFMLNDWHPDVEAFINVKRDLKKVTNANISVAVSDEFMAAVKDDRMWPLRFPDTSHSAYNSDWDGDLDAWVSKGYPYKVYKEVSARSIWRKLAEGAWDNGEPGVIFLERYNKLSTGASVEKIIAVNPCGEQGLGANAVCNLGAMNVAAYVQDGQFDDDEFFKDAKVATRFLDNVIDKNFYGDFTETEEIQKNIRRMGLSVMGLADALIALKLRYGSPAAVKFTEHVFSTLKHAAISASAELAREKGAAPAWDKSMFNRPYFQDAALPEWAEQYGMRNLFLLTQAPTGTTSILAGVSSGIEPHFAFEYEREDRTGKHTVTIPTAQKWKNANPGQPLPDYFVTALDIEVEDHIYMQAAAQKYIDSSVSKTLNAPNSHTVEDVEKAFTLAYDCGLKSLAYFRDGCGRAQVLTTKKPEAVVVKNNGFMRASTLIGTTTKYATDVGTAFITVNRDEESKPREVFVNVGKGGTHLQELSEAIGRLASIALQKDVPVHVVAGQLLGIGGYSKLQKSLPTAVSMALSDHAKAPSAPPASAAVVATEAPKATRTSALCPNCQAFSLVHEEGCTKCLSCDYTAC